MQPWWLQTEQTAKRSHPALASDRVEGKPDPPREKKQTHGEQRGPLAAESFSSKRKTGKHRDRGLRVLPGWN